MGKTTATQAGSSGLSSDVTNAARQIIPYLERGKKERFGLEILIGPETAEFLLATNENNRSLRKTKVAQFVKDMRHGRWHNNGESIIISNTGQLNDGQHRLRAVQLTGIAQNFLVGFGYPRESRHTVDSGAARTVGEQLHMAGMTYGTTIAAAAKLILSYEQTGGRSIGRASSITSLEQQERAKADELLREVVAYCAKHSAPFVRTSLVAAAFYILSRIAPLEAKKFIDGILTGTNLNSGDPAYLVRERLMRAWTLKGTVKRMTDTEVMATILRGWNYFARGKADAKWITATASFPVLIKPRADATTVDEETEKVTTALENSEESIVPYAVPA